jgi:hypothetical protein
VTCRPISRQRVGKHIPATHADATIGRLLLGNGAVNTLFNNRIKCFQWVPCRGRRWRCVVSFTLWPLYPRYQELERELGGPNGQENILHLPGIKPRPSNPSLSQLPRMVLQHIMFSIHIFGLCLCFKRFLVWILQSCFQHDSQFVHNRPQIN